MKANGARILCGLMMLCLALAACSTNSPAAGDGASSVTTDVRTSSDLDANKRIDTVVPWDGVEREVSAWNQHHSLRSSIDVSAVWLFQHLAREVGPAQMTRWIERVGYGNATLGGQVDDFWLSGDLRTSPVEQLDFLESLVKRELPFRLAVMDAVVDIVEQESQPSWSWSYKTGTALHDDPDLGWLVGMTSHENNEWVFAMNIDLTSIDGLASQIDPRLRQELARSILVLAGELPG